MAKAGNSGSSRVDRQPISGWLQQVPFATCVVVLGHASFYGCALAAATAAPTFNRPKPSSSVQPVCPASGVTVLESSSRTSLALSFGLALSIKAVFLVLAVFGSATMWMAVFADMGASLLVVANGLRLLRA